MAEQRKASDVLLELETEVKSLKSILNLQDHLLKTILGNCNKTNAMLGALIDAQPLTAEQRAVIREQFQPAASEAIMIPQGFPVEIEKVFKGERRITRAPNEPSTKASNADIEFKDYMAQKKKPPQTEFRPKAAAQQVKSEKKIPVTQRVQDNNKKDMFMAEVNLLSPQGELVLKTKTNAMGKWQAQLAPGNYVVKASKMDTALQKKIETQQNITIPNSNSAITLSTLVINRE